MFELEVQIFSEIILDSGYPSIKSPHSHKHLVSISISSLQKLSDQFSCFERLNLVNDVARIEHMES